MKAFLFFIAIILFGLGGSHGAISIYAPGAAVIGPGNASLGLFGSSARVQTVYGQEEFPTGIPPNSAFLISGLYFRADERALPSPGTALLSGLDVRLSTTSRLPDGLSEVFSENIGPDETTVFGRGPLSVNWGQGAFITHIPFNRPFLYNPAAGNLLLDIRNYGPVPGFPSLDAFAVFGDSVSSISTGRGADSVVGGIATHGYATQFWVDIVPIPEPSTTALLLLGAAMLTWKWRRSRKSSSTPR